MGLAHDAFCLKLSRFTMAAFKKLESFDGTGDVERFIDRFEFAVTVDELED